MKKPRPRHLIFMVTMLASCGTHERDTHENPSQVEERDRDPEKFLPENLASRSDTALLRNAARRFDTDDGAQPDTLPTLPDGVTAADFRLGDELFHGAGGCRNCHGSEAQGLAGRGSTLTAGLHLIDNKDLRGIDSIIVNGIADAETRSPIAMPPRGQKGNLSTGETHAIAAYVWAIANTRGEPWSGGHATHGRRDPDASARTAIP
jgi:mono/diheme cytochrome c family protein